MLFTIKLAKLLSKRFNKLQSLFKKKATVIFYRYSVFISYLIKANNF